MTLPEGLAQRNIAMNGREWLLMKAAEECNELAAAIMQSLTKGASEARIIVEIPDVEIACGILRELYHDRIEYIDGKAQAKLLAIDARLTQQEQVVRAPGPATKGGVYVDLGTCPSYMCGEHCHSDCPHYRVVYTAAEMETAVHMGGIVESFLCGDHVEVDSMALRSMVPDWAREFEAKYAGRQWGEDDGPEFYEALDAFMDEALEPCAEEAPDAP